MEHGNVYFFTGLSGAGKTTIGGLFYRRMRAKGNAAVLLDGDNLRAVFQEHDYSDRARLFGAKRLFRMARMFSEQELQVVVCSISMYSEVRDWNRANLHGYREIYIKASRETLFRRDQKGLYTSGKSVVGVDLPFDEPKTPDIVVENDGDETPEAIVERIERAFGL